MTQTFDILHGSFNIHRNFLVEASAGTGKTFSIENCVVRLLLENNPERGSPLTIEEILIVTFTRAATHDLKTRVRANIEEALYELKAGLSDDTPFPYLTCYVDTLEIAIKRLEHALFCFDQAQIFTIHGFCSRMLSENIFEGDITLKSNSDKDEAMPKAEVRRVIRNFFRTEISSEKYCPKQLEIITNKKNSSGSEKLTNALSKFVTRGLEVEQRRDFTALFEAYCEQITHIKSKYNFTSERILEDFEAQEKGYKTTKFENRRQSLELFAQHFSKEKLTPEDFENILETGFEFIGFLDPSNARKIKPLPPAADTLHYPNFAAIIKESLKPIVDEGCNQMAIFTRMVHDCRALLKRYCDEEEKVNYDDFLRHMEKALDNVVFFNNVQKKYQVAIIDEFQDTDPKQWNIFKRLFMNSADVGKYLYIVGDPKQSIYAFRQSDIYTYLSAGEALGKESHATLDTNYRSEPRLIEGLNLLFSQESCPNFITLPKTESTLPYHPVRAGGKVTPHPFNDNMPNIHFFIAEGGVKRSNSFPLQDLEKEYFFPFIAQEIHKLHRDDNFKFSSFAILVSDRYQAQRLSLSLLASQIPHSLQRSRSLTDSSALSALREVLAAVIDPSDDSLMKAALAGKIIQFSVENIVDLQKPSYLEDILSTLLSLRTVLMDFGFTAFYESLLSIEWTHHNRAEGTESPKSLRDYLLASCDLHAFYRELQQIAELLMEEECRHRSSPETLVSFLDDLANANGDDDEERFKTRKNPNENAVTIITTHSSKGLEYDIVFYLGGLKRNSDPEKLVAVSVDGVTTLVACTTEEDPVYRHYCREIDAEKARQLYVAMTRAKHRLYLPVAIVPKSVTKPGRASPIELFLAKLGAPPADENEVYDRINGFDGETLKAFITKYPTLFSMTLLNEALFSIASRRQETIPPLTPPKQIAIPGENLYIQSFSSLAKGMEQHEKAPSLESAPHDFMATHKTEHTLPAGSDTGTLLHTILEDIPFDTKDIETFVAKYTAKTPFEIWTPCIANLIERTLNTSIDGTLIKEISKGCSYKEIEFFYPFNGDVPMVEDVEYRQGYLKGVIDLIYYHNGKYYIIDWKSNWLGSSSDGYGADNLQKAMEDHHYLLQGALYREAIKRYLKLFDPRPFHEIYGGAFYLFLRGLSEEVGSTQGIYKIGMEKWSD